jgi:hypothetical protein
MVIRDMPSELAGVVDERLKRRLDQIYDLIYQLQDAQQRQSTVPLQNSISAAIRSQLQQIGLINAFGTLLIGLPSTDPQISQLASQPGTGTVTSVAASSSATGFGLVTAPNPIIGTGSVAFSITDAAQARTTLGTELFKLSTTTLNLNTNTKQTLYTVPSGKSAVPTMVVLRSPSVDITLGATGRLNFGFDAGAVDWTSTNALQLAPSALIDSTKVLEFNQSDAGGNSLGGGTSSVIGTATQTFGVICDAAFGSAATVIVDLFGYLF